MADKNNVVRFLTQRKISHQIIDLHTTEKLSGLEVAEHLRVPPSQVYKTIVIVRIKPGKPILAVVPANQQADLKKVASVIKEKKVILPSQNDAESLTGLQAGGISPLALLNRGFKVLIDSSAKTLNEIILSAGERGLQVKLSPTDLANLTRAEFAEISSENA